MLYTVCRSPFSVQPGSPRHPCYTARNCPRHRTLRTSTYRKNRLSNRLPYGCIARSSRSHETITVMIGVVTLQRQDLSGIMAQVHAGRPSKVFCTNNVATDFELPTFTFHTTDILHLAALRIRCCGTFTLNRRLSTSRR